MGVEREKKSFAFCVLARIALFPRGSNEETHTAPYACVIETGVLGRPLCPSTTGRKEST